MFVGFTSPMNLHAGDVATMLVICLVAIIIIQIKTHGIFDSRSITALMDLQHERPLVCSINMWVGLGRHIPP
jgi:hypothetical protein